MRYFIIILIVALSLIIPLGGTGLQSGQFFHSALAQQEPAAKPWTGKKADGTVITQEDLARILANHKKWLETDEKEGERANLSKAILRGADLRKADMIEADLRGVNLREANLTSANLSWADLSGADLSKAILNGANLRGANLNNAKLSQAILISINLSHAKLIESTLIDANLGSANLSGANLNVANMSGAELGSANLSEAGIRWAILSKAKLNEANLSKALLIQANLSGANLHAANLGGAELDAASLRGANLGYSDLRKVRLKDTDLSDAFFEPIPDKLPDVDSIAEARGLANLWYKNSFLSLVKLRKAFKESGYRQQEWEITCSLKRNDTLRDWRRGGIAKIKAAFNYVFMDLTCNYGISPWRPLALLAFFILIIFPPFYWLALKSRRPDTGIWVSWLPNRVLMDEGQERPVKLTTLPPFERPVTGRRATVWWHLRKIWRILRLGLFFSLVSAFSLGLKELNVGNWISRLQKKEYILRPTGWVRTVAGIQSLISFFLLALWAFLYVGSIFESK